MTPEELAQNFHDTYERLAPRYGYETGLSTKIFDPNSPNGKLMIAVCKTILFELKCLRLVAPDAPEKTLDK
jgi:hypothetical protein